MLGYATLRQVIRRYQLYSPWSLEIYSMRSTWQWINNYRKNLDRQDETLFVLLQLYKTKTIKLIGTHFLYQKNLQVSRSTGLPSRAQCKSVDWGNPKPQAPSLFFTRQSWKSQSGARCHPKGAVAKATAHLLPDWSAISLQRTLT